jgi:uncharacterized protein (DUF58 family)
VVQSDSLALLSIPIVAYLVLGMLVTDEPHLDLQTTRVSTGGKIFEGGVAEVTTTVTNEGRSLGLLRVEDVLPEGLRVVRGSNTGIAILPEGGSLMLRYKVTSEVAGSYLVGPIELKASDSFGLRSKAQRRDEAFRLDVLPKIPQRTRVPFRPRKTENWPAQIPSPRAGVNQEFYALRQYQWGDPARTINWKATARTDRTYSNQFMSELGAEAILIVDKSASSDFGVPPESMLNYVERCAASVSSGLISAGNRVGMVVFGQQVRKVWPGTGFKQLEKMLLTLVRTERGGPSEALQLLPEHVLSHFPRASQFLVVSSLADDRILAPLLRLGSRRDLRVVSPTLVEKTRNPDDERWKQAAALVDLNKRAIMERLRRRAVVAEWRVNGPMEPALESVLVARSQVVAR